MLLSFPFFRQQYAQALAQQKAAALSSAPLQQQQQHQQQINLLLQQYQALKIRLIKTTCHHISSKYICTHASMFRRCCFFFICLCRASESLLPPVTRSLSVPDSGSVWEMQKPSSQASCNPNLQQTAPNSEFLH